VLPDPVPISDHQLPARPGDNTPRIMDDWGQESCRAYGPPKEVDHFPDRIPSQNHRRNGLNIFTNLFTKHGKRFESHATVQTVAPGVSSPRCARLLRNVSLGTFKLTLASTAPTS
jgi:hypothetical protein